MRKVLPVSLILLLFFNLFGFYLSFYVKQEIIHVEMERTVKKENYHKYPSLSFTMDEFNKLNWLEIGKEFQMNQRFYDVAEIEFTAAGVNLFVVEDIKETNLLADLVSFIDGFDENEQGSSSGKVLLPYFLPEYVLHENSSLFLPGASVVKLQQKEVQYLSFTTDRQSPPPDAAGC